MQNTRIHWVIALRPEAEPLIRRFGLKPVQGGQAGFPVWKSEDETHWLVVSGIGKVNAAAATAWLQNAAGRPNAAAWINLGIAGHRDRRIGSIVRANRVTDAGSEKSWYPSAVWKRKVDLDSAPLRTIDQPTTDYPTEDCLVDMEASGFFSTAIRFSSLELLQSIKIISDNAENDIKTISKDSVRTACESALIEIEPWLAAFQEIVAQETVRIANPPFFDELSECFRFSETLKHQLRRLLTRHAALETPISLADFESLKSGKEVVAALSSTAVTAE